MVLKRGGPKHLMRGRTSTNGQLIICALIVLAFVVAGPHGAAASESITIAVMPFDFGGGGQWSGIDVGRQITSLVTDNLVNKGDFLVVERDLIDEIIGEQDFGASGRVDPSRAAEIGRLLGADALIFGSVTRFEFSSGGGISAFGFSLSSTSASVELSGRIVDTSQGVVRGSIASEGSASGLGIDIDDLNGISFNASQFQETALGEATVKAVDDFVGNAARAIDESAEDLLAAKERGELEGAVVAVIEQGVVLNIGADDGVRMQQRFRVYRLMEVEGLTDPVRIPVGVVQVISVDDGAAVAVFEQMTQPAQVGDRVGPE